MEKHPITDATDRLKVHRHVEAGLNASELAAGYRTLADLAVSLPGMRPEAARLDQLALEYEDTAEHAFGAAALIGWDHTV